jgi:(methylthio)acryloyl-CoA hydratase
MSSEPLVSLEFRDEVALIGLNRPSKANAIDLHMADELSAALIQANSKARVGIIFGHGRHFSSGLDLDLMRTRIAAHTSNNGAQARPSKTAGVMQAISKSHIPYIAAIHGAAVGLGFELAAAMHIRVADETAFFSLPEGRRGIFVGGGGSARISRLIGVARMQDMMLTGRRYSSSEAHLCGVVQYPVPTGTALQKALELAAEIKKNSPKSNFAILQGLPRIGDMTVDDGIFWESILATTTFGSDAISRISDFLDRPAVATAASSKDSIHR